MQILKIKLPPRGIGMQSIQHVCKKYCFL